MNDLVSIGEGGRNEATGKYSSTEEPHLVYPHQSSKQKSSFLF